MGIIKGVCICRVMGGAGVDRGLMRVKGLIGWLNGFGQRGMLIVINPL